MNNLYNKKGLNNYTPIFKSTNILNINKKNDELVEQMFIIKDKDTGILWEKNIFFYI